MADPGTSVINPRRAHLQGFLKIVFRPFLAHCDGGAISDRSVNAVTKALGRVDPRVWELIIKLGISFGLSLLATRWIITMLDPQHKQRQSAQRSRKELLRRLGRDDIKTDEHEDVIAKEAVNPASIDVTFDDIGGLEEQKQRIREIVVLPFCRPELFTRGKLLRPPRGVLFYGPPGTGKTMLAKAIAKETRAVFLNVSLSTLQDKWFGESQKLVRAVFTLAWKLQPTIIFIDEIDSFLRERKDGEYEASCNMKSEFMALWDGLSTESSAQVVVIGATNRPWAIDKAILRRMPRSFLIDVPGAQQREEILRKILSHEVTEELDFVQLSKETEGYSGSDLKELCRAALLAPVQELIEQESRSEKRHCSNDLRPLKMDDIIKAKTMVTPTGESANDYLMRCTGMSADEFAKLLNINHQS
ncbi:hypothetical protein GUITHDRAFT_91001 [Guillardia theta CCMP2712]|uniref:AAA+ ATPase domain-containing protein n=2 Tax=Guillardia theta TaxID=55529 RepID=L1I8K8_GUITC|nr:hypothetical protein GUITHDRAFT_91001 [Guillardia theta CCMP2712]EKX32563.1 hypothetical protein GUITHDRAFT_91001 [Guillardia theta CCMP2712]|eukprot:XP_005819543.1 hypothetical protein GUITHDRAFT_91001 [Guillardia theta CCMP2712]